MPEGGTIDPPRPFNDAVSNFFWEGAKQHKLLILRCDACGKYIHFPRPICRFCLSTNLSPAEMSGRGTVYSYTLVMQAMHPFFVDKLPYLVATIALDEQPGLHLVGNLVDIEEDDVSVGMPVEVSFRDLAPDYPVPHWKRVSS